MSDEAEPVSERAPVPADESAAKRTGTVRCSGWVADLERREAAAWRARNEAIYDVSATDEEVKATDKRWAEVYRELKTARSATQILGDFATGKPAKTGNGAIYNHTAPGEFASKPAGEWQTVEATIIGNKITVILNGKKIHDNVECNNATGSELDRNVKEPGAFFLQGDHGTVSFRNIVVKELPKE